MVGKGRLYSCPKPTALDTSIFGRMRGQPHHDPVIRRWGAFTASVPNSPVPAEFPSVVGLD